MENVLEFTSFVATLILTSTGLFLTIRHFFIEKAIKKAFRHDWEFKSCSSLVRPGSHPPVLIRKMPKWIPKQNMFRRINIADYPQRFKITGNHVFSVPYNTKNVHAVSDSNFRIDVTVSVPTYFSPDFFIHVYSDLGDESVEIEVAMWVEVE